jgi:hypothetical protein
MKTAHSLRGFEEKMEPMSFNSENFQKTESEGSLIPKIFKIPKSSKFEHFIGTTQ